MSATLTPLLKTRRFLPFFLTQFLGAFNDNVFRQALILVIATGAVQVLEVNTQNNLALALFILPFFLFSALAGQVADKYDKGTLLRYIKFAEVCIMALAAVGFFFDAVWFLMGVLFLMGLQSTFFGPIKYSIIPQALTDEELVAGNALVEMGTFLAILLGSIAGVVLKMDWAPDWIASVAVLAIAALGLLSAWFIPSIRPAAPGLHIDWNIWRDTWAIVGRARRIQSVWYCVLGISWFWFLGAAYTTQLKVYSEDYLHGTDGLYALLLATFSIGIGLGSALCEKASGRHVELGLVPVGSLGLTIFSLDLFFAHQGLPDAETLGIAAFLSETAGVRVIIDLLLIGVFGGFYIVPLFAYVQHRSDSQNLARIIAANNILNALLMVFSAVAGIVFVGLLEFTIPEFFALLALANLVVVAVIYFMVPEFMIRLLIWALTNLMYRLKKTGLENIPREGPCLLVCNQVSHVDVLLIAGAVRRPVRFVVFRPICETPVLKCLFRQGKAISIESAERDPATYHAAFERIREALDDGEIVCIFPEGRLTTDGELGEFRAGVDKILADRPVPVVPMALRGLWGSFFSHKKGRALSKRPRRFWSRVELRVGQPVAPEQARVANLREKVVRLLDSK